MSHILQTQVTCTLIAFVMLSTLITLLPLPQLSPGSWDGSRSLSCQPDLSFPALAQRAEKRAALAAACALLACCCSLRCQGHLTPLPPKAL